MNVERGTAINGRCYATLPRGRPSTPRRDAYADGAIQPAQRIYYQHDANFNTTAIVGLIGGTWQVTQRYIYDPYGNVTVLNADWNTASSQIPLTQYLHQGGRLDPITGLYLFRHRDYSPTLGNWIEQDPAGYFDSQNMYLGFRAAPVANVDFLGLYNYINPGQPDWSVHVKTQIPIAEGTPNVLKRIGALLDLAQECVTRASWAQAVANGAEKDSCPCAKGRTKNYYRRAYKYWLRQATRLEADVKQLQAQLPPIPVGAAAPNVPGQPAMPDVNPKYPSPPDMLQDPNSNPKSLPPDYAKEWAKFYRDVGEYAQERAGRSDAWKNMVKKFQDARAAYLEGKGPFPGETAKEFCKKFNVPFHR